MSKVKFWKLNFFCTYKIQKIRSIFSTKVSNFELFCTFKIQKFQLKDFIRLFCWKRCQETGLKSSCQHEKTKPVFFPSNFCVFWNLDKTKLCLYSHFFYLSSNNACTPLETLERSYGKEKSTHGICWTCLKDVHQDYIGELAYEWMV